MMTTQFIFKVISILCSISPHSNSCERGFVGCLVIKQSRPSKETDKFVRKYEEESLCYIFSLPFFSGLLSLSLKCRPRSCHSRAGLNGSHMIFRKKLGDEV